MNNAYIKLKGFAIAIAMGLLVYLVCLAERYVSAVELEKRYYIPSGDNESIYRVDKKDGTIQVWNGERYEILR